MPIDQAEKQAIKMRAGLLLFSLFCFLCISCDKTGAFDQYQTLDNQWHKDSVITFTVDDIDLSKKYNLFIGLRANSAYPFNNIFLIVTMEHPGRTSQVDTLEYAMADQDGFMLGEGFSDIKESKLFYKENIRFRKGIYRFKIRHAVRETGQLSSPALLKGITEVGFRVESIE